MIEFRTLGTIGFRGLDRLRTEALQTQPQRIAVLAYLLLATPGSAQGRAHLVSVFWPETDGSRGRGALRAALHFLRKQLGPDALRSRGDELVIDPRLLTCDALSFEARAAEGRHMEALELYAGDLLPGIQVRNAPGFTIWLEERRAGLRRRAADAAWAQSEREERLGRWIEAVEHARRATSLSPHIEPAVRRLLGLMAQTGDRVAALREYESFASRWMTEHGVTPSAETRALAETIRRGSPTGARASPDARRWADRWPYAGKIVVLPFLLVGEGRGHEYLATGLAHDVISSLSRVASTVVVAREPAVREPEREKRDPAAIGGSLGADAVLDVSVRVADRRLILVARLIDVRTRAPVWAEVYESALDDLLSVRARLITDVVNALRIELSAEEESRLAREPTSSPSAYELYLEGRSHWSRRTTEAVEASIRCFEGALEMDPRFALALAGLADARAALHPAAGRRLSESRVRAREAAHAALALDPDLGEVHATLGLLRAFADQDWLGAEEDFRRAVELTPGHASAHHWLGCLLTFVRRRFDEGAVELETACQLDPSSPAIEADIGVALLNRGEVDEARRRLTAIVEREPTFGRAHHYLGVALFVAGDPDRGFERLRRAWRLGAFGADPDAQAGEALSRGDWREGLERKLGELTASRLQPGTRSFEAALISMLLGRRDETLEWLRVVGQQSSWAWVTMYLPAFEPLLDDPAFVELMAEAGLGQALSGGSRSSA